jgi:hypothetical protein
MQIFTYAGVIGSNTSLITSGAYGIVKLVLTLVFTCGLVDVFGRRRCMLTGVTLTLRDQFNTAISVLFAGYIALQITSNMIITRVRPSLYLPSCMIIWGLVSGMASVIHDFKGLVITRFFLGFVEA